MNSFVMTAREAAVRAGWRAIDDGAPTDGTEIIGIHITEWEGSKPTIYGPWTIAFHGKKWRSSWDGNEVLEYMSDFGIEYKEPELQPTHWQPLPTLSVEHMASEEEAERAVAHLKLAIEAAEASNQAGENAVVKAASVIGWKR